MKRRLFTWLLIAVLLLPGCSRSPKEEETPVYISITAQEAKEWMDSGEDLVILDVRTQEEYDAGHIPGAILIPDYEIAEKAQQLLKDPDQLILVYCRSGRRSKNAARDLAQMGYTNVKEFGGIIDWPYEVTEGV